MFQTKYCLATSSVSVSFAASGLSQDFSYGTQTPFVTLCHLVS